MGRYDSEALEIAATESDKSIRFPQRLGKVRPKAA